MAKENGWFSAHPVLAIAMLSLFTYLQYSDRQPLEIFFWACDHASLEVDCLEKQTAQFGNHLLNFLIHREQYHW